jgi:hypothetical protein
MKQKNKVVPLPCQTRKWLQLGLHKTVETSISEQTAFFCDPLNVKKKKQKGSKDIRYAFGC